MLARFGPYPNVPTDKSFDLGEHELPGAPHDAGPSERHGTIWESDHGATRRYSRFVRDRRPEATRAEPVSRALFNAGHTESAVLTGADGVAVFSLEAPDEDPLGGTQDDRFIGAVPPLEVAA